jgi:hypothetical protein
VVRPPYEAVYWLLVTAAANWGTYDGRFAQGNVDPFSLTFVRLCNLLYSVFYDIVSQDEKALLDFQTRIVMPVPGVERRVSSKVVEDEMALFKQSTGATG